MAITDEGYLRPTFEELLEARIEQAQELFGEDIDTSNASPLGKFIRLAVKDLAEAYEDQERIYYARFPKTATGQSLDRLMPFAAITRNPATRAEHLIAFFGAADYEIPAGFLVGTAGEEEFYLVNPLVLDADGYGEGVVQCTELGVIGNVKLGSITEIINPDVGVERIQHIDIDVIAEDEETDEELRRRFDIAILGSGSGTAVAVRGAVMRVMNVNSCYVVENDTDETDAEGRPSHSFETYVHAPESADQAIAEAIFSKKPLGIIAYGDIEKQIIDVSGGTQTVCFSRVYELPVHIRCTVAVDAYFELDGPDDIKTSLLTYVNSLGAGEDVVYTRLYRHIYGIPGVRDVTTLTISTDGATWQEANIFVPNDKNARLDALDIAVEVTDYEDR